MSDYETAFDEEEAADLRAELEEGFAEIEDKQVASAAAVSTLTRQIRC
jgi:hypothetical protein